VRASRRILGSLAGAALASAISIRAPQAAPAEQSEQCLSAYAAGQRARNAGKLLEARASFSLCGSSECPEALHPDCGRWLDEVDASLPTVVFRVVTPQGAELDGVSFSIDGAAPQVLDGRSVAIDPGEHALIFRRSGYQEREQRFTFTEGEKLSRRSVTLEPLGSASSAETSSVRIDASPVAPRRVSLVPTWIGIGVGVAGAAGFAYFGSTGRKADRELDDCSPNCSDARVSRVKRDYLFANVSLGVGAAGLVTAAVWLLLRPESPLPGDGEHSALVLELGPVTSITRRF
jgi:hypothetical protein